MSDNNSPTWSKPCDRCGTTVERWYGMYEATCRNCDASYNACGQRLRDDWYGNPSWRDDDIDDLEGFELQHSEDY